jgi:glycosyltransferase involved in cell wall biosynthesis
VNKGHEAHRQFLHVVAQYPPVPGGAERYCANASETLASNGYPILVYTSRLASRERWENELPREETRHGVSIRRFSVLQRGPITWRFYHYCRKRYARQASLLAEVGQMWAEGPVCPWLPLDFWRKRRRFELIHVFGLYSAMAWQAYLLARQARVPLVTTPFVHLDPPTSIRMRWQRQALQGSDHLIALTDQEKQHLHEQYRIPDARVSVVSPGVDLARFSTRDKAECRRQLGMPENDFVALCLGRKEEHKGLDVLIQALDKLRCRDGAPCRLLLAGPDTPYSQHLLSSVGLDRGVVDLGTVDESTKLACLNACDCLAFPSRSESFGIVITEAWAMAKPVVVARLGSTSEMVSDEVDGLLCDPGSSDDLARAMGTLRDNPERAIAMGSAGKEKVRRRYTVDVMRSKLEELYTRMRETR